MAVYVILMFLSSKLAHVCLDLKVLFSRMLQTTKTKLWLIAYVASLPSQLYIAVTNMVRGTREETFTSQIHPVGIIYMSITICCA